MSHTHQDFFSAAPERPRDDLLADYLRFLERRNGSVDPSRPFPARERWLEQADAAGKLFHGELPRDDFERGYAGAPPKSDAQRALLALLAFTKMNAGEAYGVEVVSRMRHGRPPAGTLFDDVERVLSREETYHTRILVGATRQFGLPSPAGAWRPPMPLRVLIGALAYSPKALFHPILLGAEVGGVFTFNWMLRKVGEVFADQPALAEAMEARLMEILIDELGHVAFNRMAVGPTGLAAARVLAGRVADATSGMTPELVALGWTRSTTREIDRFTPSLIPEEARRRAFYA